MTAPDSLYQLVEKFAAQQPANETELRRQFVDPLFAALGWDVTDNRQVGLEVRVLVAEDGKQRPKRPDYGFRIGGATRFFVETKPPRLNLKNDSSPAFQLRRYGWSGNLPVSVLTDFEEFCVYDCRIQPQRGDPADSARLRYWTYEQYVDVWDELEARFSRAAVADGALRSWLEGQRLRGATSVDQAFLNEMESWRAALAGEIALHNPQLSQRELNLLVQRAIDRIVFLRIAEDRDIEPYGRLRSAAAPGRQVYEELKLRFREADDKYNSGLFHFGRDQRDAPPDALSLNITIPDEPLRRIINKLYFPASPYEFSVLPSDILGQVYERFLGKVIQLDAGGAVDIQDKPEVRKAGGVYYTPSYIVDYIVENTVGALLAGKSPEQVEKLRILDPACGSGSFLTGAYQYLLDWHLEQYSQQPRRYRNRIRRVVGGTVLTTAEKRRILQANIYGVDLDQNAVEVSKLSLLLKMLENESEATGGQTLMFAAGGRILPDLSANVKWGNSLIGSDFYSGRQMDMFDEEALLRVKPFDWESDAGFGGIMAAGGFDAVIGNPPYVRQETLGKAFKDYAKGKFETYAGTADLYTYFIERGVKLLNKNGLFGIIVANKWLRARYGKPLRTWLKQQAIQEIVDFGDLPVFEQATTYPCILTIGKAPHPPAPSPIKREGELEERKRQVNVDSQLAQFSEEKDELGTSDEKPLPLDGGGVWGGGEMCFKAAKIDSLDFTNLSEHVKPLRYEVDKSLLDDGGWSLARREIQKLLRRLLDTGVSLKDYVDDNIYRGILTGLNEAFVIDEDTKDRLISEDASSEEIIKPFLAGRDMKRYSKLLVKRYVICIPSGWTNENKDDNQSGRDLFIESYPAVAAHLEPFHAKAEKRWDKGEYWWELRACAYYEEFEKPKIMLPDISLRGNFTCDTNFAYCTNTAYIIPIDDKYLLGILNSKLTTYLYQSIASTYRGGYLRFIYQYLAQLPIRTIDFDDPADVAMHDEMVALVDAMLDLHRQLPALSGEARRIAQARIDATDRRIDALVYRLYGLSADEIAIVEG